jgi:hypothetical protein
MKLIVNSLKSLEDAQKALETAWLENRYLTVSIVVKKKRTLTQNSAMHLYFRMLADTLNDAGLDQRKTLKPNVEIPWNETAIKELIWRPIQLAVVSKESSAELTTTEIQEVYEVLNRHLADRFGISLPWPEREENG